MKLHAEQMRLYAVTDRAWAADEEAFWDQVRAAIAGGAAVDIPAVAIGGISRDNILELAGCGLDGVAVVSALFAQPDVKAAAEEMLRLSQKIARP